MLKKFKIFSTKKLVSKKTKQPLKVFCRVKIVIDYKVFQLWHKVIKIWQLILAA